MDECREENDIVIKIVFEENRWWDDGWRFEG